MSIMGAITGIIMLFNPTNDTNINHKIYDGMILSGKIVKKSDENSWSNSLHEETHHITKDTILKLVGLK